MATSEQRFYYYKGRTALYALLEAAGIGDGDLVVIPGYTCIVVPFAIKFRGAEPLYADIDSTTYNIDPGALAKLVRSHPHREKIRAVIAQHTYGIPCEMDPLMDLAREHDLLVIEDACHALGSRYRGRATGKIGSAAFYSSQWSKPVTTGLGGWAVANDPELRSRLASLYGNYVEPSAAESWRLDLQRRAYDLTYRPELAGTIQTAYRRISGAGLMIGSSTKAELLGEMPANYKRRMGPRQVRQLESLLARADAFAADRRATTARLEAALETAGMPVLELPDHLDPVLLRYPMSVSDRQAILTAARERHIELGDWFISPVHPKKHGWETAGYMSGSCPRAEAACACTINLPTHHKVDDKAMARAVELLAEFRP